jgi:amidase
VAQSQWSFKTAVETSAALAAKQVSAVELAQDAIGRIERHDAKINAICVRDFDRALAAARAADAALAHGEQKPLLGIPMTVKESYNIAGLPTTWGIPEQKDFTPTEDALSIARVKDAGAVILGKTNVPLRYQPCRGAAARHRAQPSRLADGRWRPHPDLGAMA